MSASPRQYGGYIPRLVAERVRVRIPSIRHYDQKLSGIPDSVAACLTFLMIPGMSCIFKVVTHISTLRSSTEGTAVSYTKLFIRPEPDSRHLLFTPAKIV
ncbi:hypothetical protein TNCV_1533481 [Trichonephila clavipes]|nr:hypothetical protein TNCV_1533481 [Trichonephila clavipes]